MIKSIFLLIVGFVFLIKGADYFVDGSSKLAEKLHVSKMLVGLTIVAFGTSAPEFAISISSLVSHNTDMLLGNIIGSNILNVLLIIGLAATICPLKVKNNTIKKEIPMCLLISTLLVVLFLDIKINNDIINIITRSDAIAILLFFAVFVYYILSISRNKIDDDIEPPKDKMIKLILFILLGLTAVILGSNMVVDNASFIATKLGITQRIISLTIVAFGTSLPELVTTITSIMKKEQDILLGNIIGSNIFNICIVLGIPVALFGGITTTSFSYMDLFFLLLSSLILFIFSYTNSKITKLEGILMLMLFGIYYTLVFVI